MNKKFKKIVLASASIILSSVLLIGCSGKESKNQTELLDSKKDLNTKVAIVTQSKKENERSFSSAESEKLNSLYRIERDPNKKSSVEHFVLPDNFENNEKETQKVFDKIKKDKKINVLVLSSNKPGTLEYVKELKKERKDIMTISANLNEDDKSLINNFDLNFESGNIDRGERIAELAKSLGAERFIYFTSDKDLSIDKNKKILDGIISKSKECEMPIEEIKIPSELDSYQKKAFLSNQIDELVKKYGKDINIYTFDSDLDEVLASKLLDKKFFVSEFSQPNVSKLLMKVYGKKGISRMQENYVWMNSQIGTFLRVNYDIERRVGASAVDADSYIIKFASELGSNLKSKSKGAQTAYNSYFLEKISRARGKTESGFVNKYKGVGNFKIIDPDQIVY
ncbi:MAG: DUF3798 domain-containing protein [Peptostreptococcus sp.]|uniref:DUF3798 domain-containing protein n=1 Tax=Peptostreptococcus sp. TaxID=1262 RepID=UPI002FC8F637